MIKTKDYHPAHLEAANIMSCLEKTMTTSNSSDSFLPNLKPVLYPTELTAHRAGLAEWWKSNTSSLPHLANLALSELGALPSNVLSERLFSYTEDVTSKNRCQLLPANAKWLVALQCNLPTLCILYQWLLAIF